MSTLDLSMSRKTAESHSLSRLENTRSLIFALQLTHWWLPRVAPRADLVGPSLCRFWMVLIYFKNLFLSIFMVLRAIKPKFRFWPLEGAKSKFQPFQNLS